MDDEGEEYGEGEGLYLQSWVVNLDSGWTAEQVRFKRPTEYIGLLRLI